MVNVDFDRKHALDADAGFDPSTLKGKSVIITGGASGIGEASLRAFVAAGAFVTVGDVAEDRGTALVTELGKDKVAFVKCDTTVWQDQLALFKTALQSSPNGTLDIVFANAGVARPDTICCDEVEPESGDPKEPQLNTFRVNYIGMTYTARLAIHYLSRQPQGEDRDRCLILTASASGYGEMAGWPEYTSSKWATRGLMRSLRGALPAHNARVNLVAPWFMPTKLAGGDFWQNLSNKGVQFTTVEDVASAVLHIASDKNVNGRAIGVYPPGFKSNQRGYLDNQEDNTDEGLASEMRSLMSKREG